MTQKPTKIFLNGTRREIQKFVPGKTAIHTREASTHRCMKQETQDAQLKFINFLLAID